MVRELLIVSLACSAVVAPALVESLLGTTCPAVAWLGLFAGLVALPRGEVRGGARDRSLALLVIAIAIVNRRTWSSGQAKWDNIAYHDYSSRRSASRTRLILVHKFVI